MCLYGGGFEVVLILFSSDPATIGFIGTTRHFRAQRPTNLLFKKQNLNYKYIKSMMKN